jgi:hypothetical protein
LSVREVNEGAGQRLYVNGEDFREVTAVWFGDVWSRDYRVDGTSVITAEVPSLTPGAYYVVVQSGDNEYSDTHDQCVIEVRATSDGDVAAALRLDSITPDSITLGRSADYWVKGTGMLGVSAVMLGSSACTFSATDDETLVVTVPEQPRDVNERTTSLWIYPKRGDALSLTVNVATGPSAAPDDPVVAFMVWGASPSEVPAAGGQVTLEGDGLTDATRALLGDVDCIITSQERGRLVLQVPPLDGFAGQFLVATVVSDSAVASNALGAGVRVAA